MTTRSGPTSPPCSRTVSAATTPRSVLPSSPTPPSTMPCTSPAWTIPSSPRIWTAPTTPTSIGGLPVGPICNPTSVLHQGGGASQTRATRLTTTCASTARIPAPSSFTSSARWMSTSMPWPSTCNSGYAYAPDRWHMMMQKSLELLVPGRGHGTAENGRAPMVRTPCIWQAPASGCAPSRGISPRRSCPEAVRLCP